MYQVKCIFTLSGALKKMRDQLIREVWTSESCLHPDVKVIHDKGANTVDCLDQNSIHVFVFYHTELVGYGRVSLLNQLDVFEEISSDTNLSYLTAYISRLVVHPKHRGQGISKVIHQTRIQIASDVGADQVVGWAVGDIPTLNLLKFGFKALKSKDSFKCDWYDAHRKTTLMCLDLKPLTNQIASFGKIAN